MPLPTVKLYEPPLLVPQMDSASTFHSYVS